MQLSDFDYHLPIKSIAQKPKNPRDSSRLLVYNRRNKKIVHDHFYNISKYLNAGDLLVFNDTKVFPARLLGKKETGGKAEILLLEEIKKNVWKAVVGAKNKKPGMKILFGKDLTATLQKRLDDLEWQVKFDCRGDFYKTIEKIGQVPLPPYIKSKEKQSRLKKEYQTVYAKKFGSAAAPTAGFHFTKNVLSELKKKGIEFAYVTLHVGVGTFAPVRAENIKEHQLHSEKVEINETNLNKIFTAKAKGRKIIAVGTTSARVLEGVIAAKGIKKAFKGQTNIFIYPGYKFRLVDGLITNFHLPKSSLIMLVAALMGRVKILDIYKLAIKKKYRFYSFGDAMIII
ncbi:MAG: tRNA preQ1(34) S-adenosylmethionine ribosyltransferase-isomerase QueA [Patescibacteria group bacterium]